RGGPRDRRRRAPRRARTEARVRRHRLGQRRPRARRGGSRPLRRDLARGARVVPRGRTARRIMMRVVAIAAGSHIFGAAHVPALEATGAEVVGVYDVRPEGAEAVAAPRGWRVAPTLDELL